MERWIFVVERSSGQITDSGKRREVDMRGRGKVGDSEVEVLDVFDGP